MGKGDVNEYRFEDIEIGLASSFEKRISQEDLDMFLKITSDHNPMHIDEDYARSKGFEGKVVFGMLTASMLSTLAGVYLPGKRSLILSVETNFVKPCYVGDILTITGEVIDKKDFANIIKIKVTITNHDKNVVLKGSMLVKVQD